MRSNLAAVNTERTYEGAHARTPKSKAQLERLVATCLLFENTFYESGNDIAENIRSVSGACSLPELSEIAIKAKREYGLRHVPLYLVALMDLRRKESPSLVRYTLEQVVLRPDEMGELLSIIQRVNENRPVKKVLSAAVKKGLAWVFRNWNEYQLAKWNRPTAIKLRDVMRLVHPKPKDKEQSELWGRLKNNELATPDTWEVALSSGADKKATWTRLLSEEKLGYVALIMNLRNMIKEGVDLNLIRAALQKDMGRMNILPFKFIAAAAHAPALATELSEAMLRCTREMNLLPGKTLLLVDVSGSMKDPLSEKSTMQRKDAAAALAILLRELCHEIRIFSFSNDTIEIPNYRGIPLAEKIWSSQKNSGTYLQRSTQDVFREIQDWDRILVITDEQAGDGIAPLPAGKKGYILNVAPYRPALLTNGAWQKINGFSERVVDFIRLEEGLKFDKATEEE